MAAFGAAVAISAAPAFANVTSNTYTIGTVSGAVSGLAVSPTTVTTSTVGQSFALTFTATAALTTGNTITVNANTAAPLLFTAMSNAQVIDHSNTCFFNAGNPLGATISTFTVTLPSSCSVAIGDSVEVDFQAETPATTGTLAFAVATTNNGASASVNVTVTSQPPSASASVSSLGADATYTITGVGSTPGHTWGALSVSPATSFIELTSTASGISWFPSASGAGYSVTYTPTGGSATADAVTSATVFGVYTVVLALTNPLPAAVSTATITATGQNPSTAGNVGIGIVPEQTSGAIGTNPTENATITFGTSVTTPVVVASPALASAPSTYTVSFKATTCFNQAGCAVASNITFGESTGATGFASVNGVLVTDTTQGWHTVLAIPGSVALAAGSAVLTLPAGDAVSAGDQMAVILANVTNPSAQTVSDFAVSTGGDTLSANASAYAIGLSSNTGVTVTPSPSTTGSLATYTISNIHATGALTGGSATAGQIGFQFPVGTVLPNSASDYLITDTTTTTGSGAVGTISTAVTTVDGVASSPTLVVPFVVITVPNTINSGDVFTVTVQDIINPPTSSSSESVTLQGAVSGPAVTEPAFPGASVSYPDGGVVNFSGTYYLFAGGHAFGIPTLAVLAGVQTVDHATVITAATGAAVPSVAPAIGSVIVVYNNPTIYVVGTDSQLHGFATPTQFLGDGYDPADVITVPNIAGLTVGATAGSVGTGATALATSANGAIVNSSGTYYVFAGGKAFGIPTPAWLAAVQAADTATPLTGTITSAQTGATIRSGTVVTLNSAVWVASGGTLFAFKSMAQLQADGYGGTPSIVIPNVGGLTAVIAYTGS
jgi:hypothetical protein